MGDETYLESFVESISTLPHEVRRNLDLMKNLDQSSAGLLEQLRRMQQSYITKAQEKVLQLQATEKGVPVVPGSDEFVIPTTEEMLQFVHEPQAFHQIQSVQRDALQQSEEKIAIARQTSALVDATINRLDHDLAKLESLLQATGQFQAPGTAKPDDLAAIQVTPGSADWILAKVISHDPRTGIYTLSDEDVESNKIFHLPESQVVVLGFVDKLSRGDIVFAVYPDTTSFYQATVVQAPRKQASNVESYVMVHFVDDSDEHGITHDKAVLMKHVMPPPYGVTLQ